MFALGYAAGSSSPRSRPRGTARKGAIRLSSSGTGECGSMWRARGGILPTGPEEPQSTPRASAGRRERTGHASREPDVLASVRPGSRECRPRPSMSCGCAASRVASARPWPAASTLAAPRPRAFSPLPGQWSPAVLWVMILPSSRSLIAYPHDGQRPVFSVPISRGVPLPDGGANRFPGTAGGHEATGMPGHAVVSTMTSLPGLPLAGGCRPSQAGRKIAGRSYCSGSGRRRGRGTRTGRCRRARRRMRIAALHASRPGRPAARRGTAGRSTGMSGSCFVLR